MTIPGIPSRPASGSSIGVTFTAGAVVLALGLALGGIDAPAASITQSSRAESIAAFQQVARVLDHPRCQNCHTITNYPTQGDDRHPHRIQVHRGTDDRGVAAMRCTTCHGSQNNRASGAPGAEDWHLAPLSMGWAELSPGKLCRNLLDPARNGGRSGRQVLDHLNTPLVEWGWAPGSDRQGRPRSQPPLSHAEFVQTAERWIATGAACPDK